MAEKKDIRIRFNTHYKEGDSSQKEWRVIVNGQENFCNHVVVNCPSYTTRDLIEGAGLKWHISCQASEIRYVSDIQGHWPSNFFKEIIIS